jgi:prepilin signal peptidase PulO-like enzyme (type II secretory pathway)
MDILSLVFIFILGTLVGSFINVVGLRYNSSRSPLHGRSMCMSCGTELKWYELIPVVSFFFLRGKCRSCKTVISWQYPAVELLMGFIFVGLAIRQYMYFDIYGALEYGLLYSILFFIFYAVVFSLLTIIVIYDIHHMIIPNSFVYVFMVLSMIKLGLFFYTKDFQVDTIDMYNLATPILFFSIFAGVWFMSQGRWMGFGDAKLVLGIGALLGFVLGVSAIILAFWLGALFSVGMMLYTRFKRKDVGQLTMTSEVPFAPFLVLGTLIVFFTHIDVLHIGQFFSFLQ